MSGYVLDDSALLAGLRGGDEGHRRELSRLLHDAIAGGPRLAVPALCLPAVDRMPLAAHLADIIAAAPAGAVEVRGLTRTERLDRVRAAYPWLDWPAVHATVLAQAAAVPILTAAPARYGKVAVDVLTL